MAKRIAYLLLAVLLVAGAGVIGYRVLRSGPATQTGGSSDGQFAGNYRKDVVGIHPETGRSGRKVRCS
jgi:hypothetical protein